MSYVGQGTADKQQLQWNTVTQVWELDPSNVAPGTGVLIWVWKDTAVAPLDQDGTFFAPFDSIQDALTSIGAPVDADDQAKTFTIMVVGGSTGSTPFRYDEDLVVPTKRRIFLVALAPILLGGGAATGDVSWAVTDGLAPLPAANPVLAFRGRAVAPWFISGGFTFTDGGDDVEFAVVLDNTAVTGGVDGTGLTGAGTTMNVVLSGQEEGSVGGVYAAVKSIVTAENWTFGDTVSVKQFERVDDSFFAGTSITVVTADGGFYNCQFTGITPSFNGPVSSFLADGASWFSFQDANGTFGGGGPATVKRIDIPFTPSVSVALDHTIDPPNNVVFVTGGLPVTIDLPFAPQRDEECVVKDAAGGAAAANITIDGNGNTIDGAASVLIAADYGSRLFKFNGTEWSIV
jgi:hypothetical protein